MEGANKRMNVEAWATNPAIHKASKRMKRVEYGELEMILPEMSLGKMAASASAPRNSWNGRASSGVRQRSGSSSASQLT